MFFHAVQTPRQKKLKYLKNKVINMKQILKVLFFLYVPAAIIYAITPQGVTYLLFNSPKTVVKEFSIHAPKESLERLNEIGMKQEAKEIFAKINEIRQNYGRKPLAWDDRLYELALFRAKDMVERGYFSHMTPEGKCVKDFKDKYGLNGYSVAENLFKGDLRSMCVDEWMRSRGHRYNLLYPHKIGAVACYSDICVFLGGNHDGFGDVCTTAEEGVKFWKKAPRQLYEL